MDLQRIAEQVNGILIGENVDVSALSSLEDIKDNSLIFVDNPSLLNIAESSNASAIMVPSSICTSSKPLIQVKNPKLSFFSLLSVFYPSKQYESHISPQANISSTAIIGKNTHIAANVSIGEECIIGDNCVLKPGVVLGDGVTLGQGVVLHANVSVYEQTAIGDYSTVHAGSVLGSDGFGYVFDGQKQQKIPHVGRVVVGKEVEIGANTVIDRATFGETIIGDGTKIDNLVQIAHNVSLGKNNIVCAFTGIAGSCVSGDNVVFAANVGVADHVTIEDNVILGARAAVPPKKVLSKGSHMLGAPAREERKAAELFAAQQRLPSMRKSILKMQKQIAELEKTVEQE